MTFEKKLKIKLLSIRLEEISLKIIVLDAILVVWHPKKLLYWSIFFFDLSGLWQGLPVRFRWDLGSGMGSS